LNPRPLDLRPITLYTQTCLKATIKYSDMFEGDHKTLHNRQIFLVPTTDYNSFFISGLNPEDREVSVKFLKKSGVGWVFPAVADISSERVCDCINVHVQLDNRKYKLL